MGGLLQKQKVLVVGVVVEWRRRKRKGLSVWRAYLRCYGSGGCDD